MANRYWVGGTDNWNNTAGSKWATSSGGAGGETVPTSSDDVYFDANSGSGTCTVTSYTAYCKKLTFTGYIGTFTNNYQVSFYGNIILDSNVTYSGTSTIRCYASASITANGATIPYLVRLGTTGVTLTFVDDFISTNYLYFNNGTITANANMTILAYYMSYGGGISNITLNMGSSTWTLTGQTSNYCWYIYNSNYLIINCNTSTIKYTGSDNVVFRGQARTYYNLWQAGNGELTIYDSNTFNDIKVDGTKTFKGTGGTTQTITTLTAIGTLGNLAILTSTNTTPFIFSDSAGTNDCDYLNLSYCTAQGGATFQVGYNSLIGESVTGWDETGFTNPANAYADDASYATGYGSSGIISVALSWDGGTTYTSALDKTFAGEATQTYGDGSVELWGRAWVGDDVDDTSFRVKVTYAGGRYQIYKTFGFSPDVAVILTGIEVTINALYSSNTTSLDHLAVKIYYGTSTLPIQAGSQAYASDGRKAGEGVGAGTGVLAFNDGSNWIACDTGATVAA